MKKYALIVAGGSGLRMGSDIPKQFLPLSGKPILMHTLNAFAKVEGITIIVVLPANQIEHWEMLRKTYALSIEHHLVEGGETRFHSVRNGLDAIEANSLVAIHDGVRPLISPSIIHQSFEIAQEKGNAVVAVKLKDSLREITLTGYTRNANRNNYYLVQTPQTFQTSLIKKAYVEAGHYNFTDDAGVFEENGGRIHLIDGDYSNIKITTPEDLKIAEALLG